MFHVKHIHNRIMLVFPLRFSIFFVKIIRTAHLGGSMYRKLHAYYDELGKIINTLLDYPQSNAVLDAIDILHNHRKRMLQMFLDLQEKQPPARHSPKNLPAPTSARSDSEKVSDAEAPHSQHVQRLSPLSLAAISFEQSFK
jgi:hypothetical protein